MKRRVQILVLALAAAFLALPASSASADPPPTVTISKDRAYYVSGQTENITVVVAGAGSGKGLRITVTYPNGTTKVVEQSGAYDDTFHFSYALYVNHKLTADILDGSTVVATKTLAVTEVASITTDAKSGYLGHSGAYLVYSRGNSPTFRSTDLTGKVASRCLRHELQRRSSSGWKSVRTSACQAESSRHVDWKWAGKHPSGVHFRVRATFAGDRWNSKAHAAWLYFRFK